MSKKVYKIPIDKVSAPDLRSLTGKLGSKLNPIQDIDNNWIISQEEWGADEFQYLKQEYLEIAESFILIDYKPRPEAS